jgi:ribosomal protein S27E
MSKVIGETVYWVESHTHYGLSIPCPMCFGKQFVTIILGDESQTKIECGMCSHGLDRATGQARTWDAAAFVRSGVITGISTREGIKYEVGYQSVYAHECFDSKEAAEPARLAALKEVQERRSKWAEDNFVNCKKSQIWHAGYHRSCIESAERSIEWHKARLGMIKDRAQNASMTKVK